MIRWTNFPRNKKISTLGRSVIEVFEKHENLISSGKNNHLVGTGNKDSHSNSVLLKISKSLIEIGFQVETGKKKAEKINVPVLFGEQGKSLQSFDADAYHLEGKLVLEVEAGRAVTNYQFLKDFFQACVMVDVEYLIIAVRQIYKEQKDYETICNFFDSMYSSGRLNTQLKSVLIIGY